MNDGLKTCPNPWCTGTRLIIWDLYSRRVKCTCGVVGPRSATKVIASSTASLFEEQEAICDKEAISAWNTRATDDKVQALVDALAPYAALAKHHAADAHEWGPFDSVTAQVSIRNLRDARAALAQFKEGEP